MNQEKPGGCSKVCYGIHSVSYVVYVAVIIALAVLYVQNSDKYDDLVKTGVDLDSQITTLEANYAQD